MNLFNRNLSFAFLLFAAGVFFLSPLADANAQEKDEPSSENAEWTSLFDGKTMDGWEKVGKKDSNWEVKDGALCGSGTQSMLVYAKSAF